MPRSKELCQRKYIYRLSAGMFGIDVRLKRLAPVWLMISRCSYLFSRLVCFDSVFGWCRCSLYVCLMVDVGVSDGRWSVIHRMDR